MATVHYLLETCDLQVTEWVTSPSCPWLTFSLMCCWSVSVWDVAQKRTVPFFAWSLLESVGLTDLQLQPDSKGMTPFPPPAIFKMSLQPVNWPVFPSLSSSEQSAAAPSPCTAATVEPGGRCRRSARCSTVWRDDVLTSTRCTAATADRRAAVGLWTSWTGRSAAAGGGSDE